MKRLFTCFLACAVLLLFAVPSYAVGFVKSPGEKPQIIIEGDERLMLVTTPVECIDETPHAQIKAMLASAWAQIAAAEDLSDLTPEVIPALERIKAESEDPLVQTLTIKDFVVCDLFDVSLIGNRTELVHSESGQIQTFSVKTDLRPGDVFLFLHNIEGTTWEVVERWDLASDGVLLVALDSLSPMVIAVPGYYNMEVDLSGPISPQTDDRSLVSAPHVIMAAAALMLPVAAVLYRKKYCSDHWK